MAVGAYVHNNGNIATVNSVEESFLLHSPRREGLINRKSHQKQLALRDGLDAWDIFNTGVLDSLLDPK